MHVGLTKLAHGLRRLVLGERDLPECSMKLRLVDASERRVAHVAVVLGEYGARALRMAESRERPSDAEVRTILQRHALERPSAASIASRRSTPCGDSPSVASSMRITLAVSATRFGDVSDGGASAALSESSDSPRLSRPCTTARSAGLERCLGAKVGARAAAKCIEVALERVERAGVIEQVRAGRSAPTNCRGTRAPPPSRSTLPVPNGRDSSAAT